ncbi:BPS1-LIKE PROTEIN [Salix purpurea]|uniref:BPS1-LIKE PROTEIN n=1 Tax=Salix purpurea TaxID=77065 RepID=A0A9Q0SXD3_SALPP|nr:BPS1-LIKE PROTEIN [Salix purpurea]
MALHHTRSNSLPSRPQPLTSQIDEHFSRLNASQATSSSSSSSICHKLSCLQDLHDCVDKLILLPSTQKSLSQEQNEKWIDDVLDGSLRVLDVCSVATDALLQTKECAQELQSIMRRRRGNEIGVSSEIKRYLTSRKMVKNTIHKASRGLKYLENKSSLSPSNKYHEAVAVVSMLKEVEAVTLTVLESLMTLISGGAKAQSKLGGWSLVSKLTHHKRIACEAEETEVNEFEKLDSALHTLIYQKTCKSDSTGPLENVQQQLKDLDLCNQELEEGLENLYRRLIKTRVSLLNTFVN